MGDSRRRHPLDRGGDWFVDTTCFDCDVARQLAPGLILEDARGLSYFARSPRGHDEQLQAWRALLACPTGSIGAPSDAAPPSGVFPYEVAPGVWLTGYNSRDSFGANAYLVVSPEGNVLVDSPRWAPRLADAIEALGGLRHIVLTHRDDVADYNRYARRFQAEVWIHRDDADAAPDATRVFDQEVLVQPDLRGIPLPGHTKGSAAYVWQERVLFSGDSLAWSRRSHDLQVFPDATWYSWTDQADSLERLAETARFEWLMPGHGGRGHAHADDMRQRLRALVHRMRQGAVKSEW